MKSNPTVYTYTPFRFLAKPEPTSKFLTPVTITVSGLKRLLGSLPRLHVPIRGSTREDCVLHILLDSSIRFGEKTLITNYRQEWLEKIGRFTKRGKPIQFTILGFSFKTPVSLKTDRTLPDLGDVLALRRLYEVMALISRVYRPGARVTVFTEGPFAPFARVGYEEAQAYYRRLVALNRVLGYGDRVRLIDLASLERFVPDFPGEFKRRAAAFQNAYRSGEPEVRAKYASAFPSVFRIMNSRKYPESDLRAVYADNGHPPLTQRTRRIKQELLHATKLALARYFAYLKVRDDFKLIGQACPGALALTVSPKPHRLGVHPISRDVTILHTHGVPVVDERKRSVRIMYLYDLTRTGKQYVLVFLRGDKEHKPFYYKVFRVSRKRR